MANLSDYYGKLILAANLEDNVLTLDLEGTNLKISDDGQSCCESRYMTTADELSWLVGKKLTRIELKGCTTEKEEYNYHGVQFLEVMTNQGCVTLANHNEHNGYYGGFCISAAVDGKEVATW